MPAVTGSKLTGSAVIGDVEELVALIRRTAQQEALDIEATARQQSEQILRQAKIDAQHVRQQLLEQAQRQVEQEEQRQHAQATLAGQRRRLQEREELLNQVWQMAEEKLRLLPNQPEYVQILGRLAQTAAQILGGTRIMLAADPVGHALLTTERLAEWNQRVGVVFEAATQAAPTWGGLLATDEGGRRQVDATFSTRLTLAQEELREQVAARLEVA